MSFVVSYEPAFHWPSASSEAFAFHWPGGRGEEVGLLNVTVDQAWDRLAERVERLSLPVQLTEVLERGGRGVFIEGDLPGLPLTLASDDEVPDDLLAICADVGADPIKAAHAARLLLGAHDLRFYHEDAS